MSIKGPNNNENISAFSMKVYDATRLIPKGKVSTYGHLAKVIGAKGGSRAVGQALHKNPFAPEVPCHRVVRSDGTLGGFALGTNKKSKLLSREGVRIEKGKIDLNVFGY